MPAPSKLISLLPVFVAPSSQLKIEYSDKIEAFQFLSNNPGHKLLHNRSKRSNAGYFEEFSPPSLKDECIDEVCSQEEMSEIVGGKPAEKENLKNSLSKSCTYGGTSLSDLLKEDAEQRAKREACDTRRTLKCIQKWAEHSCECLPGWKGSGCKEMEDFCADNKAADNTPLCPQGYQCVNQPRSGRNPENNSDDIGFICKLKPGFATDDVDSSNLIKKIYNIKRLRGLETEDVQIEKSYPFASDIDECLDPANNVCGQLENRQCKNVDSGYYCECITGFRDKLTSAQIESLTPEEITAMNGHPDQEYSSCDDIDECKERPNICQNTENSHCTNTIGSFTCDCDSGFDIKNGGAGDTGKVCEDINECEVHNIADNYNCLQCANEIPGEYEVTCNYGQAKQLKTDDGSLEWECVDVDECAENKSKCPLHSKCVNLESMPDQCGTGRESFLNNESPWWGYGCECEHPYSMQNFQCALCNWDYVDTKIVTDHPDPKLAELTEEEDLNSDFEQICEKYRNENIGFCLQGDVGIKIEKTKSADDCFCGDESNPTADASKVDESNCSADKKVVKEVYTCPCDYAQCEFQPEELDEEPQCEVEDPDSACENADADNKVPGVLKFYEICTCPDGNNGECSRIEEEEQADYNNNIDYDADPEEGSSDQQFVPAPQKDEQQPDAAIIVKRIESYEDDQMIVENSTEVIETYYEEDGDENDDSDSDNVDTIVYDYNYEDETLDRGDFNNTRRRRKRASESEDDAYFSADAEKPKFINYAVGTRLEIKSKREECSFLCAPVAMKEAEPECLEADIYSDWVGEGPCLDINDNEVTCGDAWRKTTRKCKCGPCKHLCDESLLESQDPAIRNCKHQLANEQWPETCPTIPPPAADEACEYGEYEEDALEIEVDDSDQIDLGLEELSDDQDTQDYIQEDYNNSR